MKTIIIGGTGHIGSYLVPRLHALGHEITVICRGKQRPHFPHAAWNSVKFVHFDKVELDKSGSYGKRLRELNPETVIDLISFEPGTVRQMVEGLEGQVRHFLHCGTMWVHGHGAERPVTESHPRQPLCEYGRNKKEIEEYLQMMAQTRNFPMTIVHPGHIVGSGWVPVNPAGNCNPNVFSKLACGENLRMPNMGMETVHHVHADDIAQLFQQSIIHRSTSLGESFNGLSPTALSLRGYAETVAGWFGEEANLTFLPFEEWKLGESDADAADTYSHIVHSIHGSIEKAKRLIAYVPRYTSLQAINESVVSLVEQGTIMTKR